MLTNIAAQGTASSSGDDASRPASMAIDGSFSTRWGSATNTAGTWLQVSFATPRTLGRVVLSESGEASSTHEIHILENGAWKTVASSTTIRANRSHDFTLTSTTAIRVFFPAVQAGKPNITEFQVYAVASGADMCRAGNVLVNATVDCGGITLGTTCAGGSESQQPVLTLNNATVKNLRINANAADGIHCVAGHCRAENVVWEDVCEDAATLKDNGVSFTISGGSANAADDKVFQHNSKNSTYYIDNFQTYNRIGKLWRSCGDCTNNGGPRNAVITNTTINGSAGLIAGANRNYGDKVTIRNMRIKGWNPGGSEIYMEYKGVEKGSGKSSELGLGWGTATCDVTQADITGF